jgi:uncharacterized protein YecT (DUF1311 family)
MRRPAFVFGLLGGCLALLLGAGSLEAQALEPEESVARCEAYANGPWREAQPNHPVKQVMFVPSEAALSPVEPPVAGQSWTRVLTGGAILKREQAATEDVRYTCLLSESQEVLFFYVQPNGFPNFMAFCSAEAMMAHEVVSCLKRRYKAEEAERLAREAVVLDAARDYDAKSRRTNLARFLRKSEADWLAYRKHICQARLEAVAGANHPDIPYYDCMLIHTRERLHALHHYPPTP